MLIAVSTEPAPASGFYLLCDRHRHGIPLLAWTGTGIGFFLFAIPEPSTATCHEMETAESVSAQSDPTCAFAVGEKFKNLDEFEEKLEAHKKKAFVEY